MCSDRGVVEVTGYTILLRDRRKGAGGVAGQSRHGLLGRMKSGEGGRGNR